MASKNIATCNQTNIQFLDTEETWDIRIDGGYFKLHKGYKGKRYIKYYHRHVYEQEFGKIPKGHIIHHVDGNTMNNDLSNLKMLTIGDHSKLHNTTHGLSKDMTAYRSANKDKMAAYRAAYMTAYRAANKDKMAAYRAAYRVANKEKIAAYQAAYQTAYQAAYRSANKDKMAAYRAAYQVANKEKIAAQVAAKKLQDNTLGVD